MYGQNAKEKPKGVGRDACRRLALSGAMVLLCALTGGASAQTTAVAHGSPSNIVLSLPVTASIASTCGFASSGVPSETFTIASDLKNAFTHDVGFVLQCTVASRIAVVSQNGGLLTPISPPPGYSSVRNYDVALHVVGDPGVPVADGNCAAATLKPTAATCVFYGTASPSIGLGLGGSSYNQTGSYLRLSSTAYAASATLVASNAYSDTLTVTLSAAS